tara:strand:- start:615 stop:1088 length:474 start_codon:yes stop_codon:yes gene_type:complete
MNPDYYKTNEKKLYKHELDRVKKMDDDQLYTRYGKMAKQEKIRAFHEALCDEKRAPKLRKKMHGNHGILSPAKAMEKTITMNFVKVIKNEDDCKQALFLQPEMGQFYLYSYVNNEMAHETMVFHCDATGTCDDMKELAVAHGYEHSTDMMDRLMETL